ncbi:reverse transcriptase [Plakobranchus ocellatus]|uniref:Reverse transcriptase n=1 Tax=Plakobranchus ocellatus TaxID=259542 RepID=A0AAV3Y017_9GAST|nr:reverse transcriptase [Plakobranchus ocellatus]
MTVQKGSLLGVSVCLEPTTMIWEAYQRTKSGKQPECLLVGPYLRIPLCLHQMIHQALRLYHIVGVQVMLEDCFNGFKMRFSAERYTTDWINLKVGISMGCTLSPILFVLAMEVILRAVEGGESSADLGGGCYMPSLKAFMDDTTILCSKENETHRMLVRLDALMNWSRMSFKPKKSRSLSL